MKIPAIIKIILVIWATSITFAFMVFLFPFMHPAIGAGLMFGMIGTAAALLLKKIIDCA